MRKVRADKQQTTVDEDELSAEEFLNQTVQSNRTEETETDEEEVSGENGFEDFLDDNN
jgi:hypothetical protein